MATPQQNIAQAFANACNRLAEIDMVPLSERAAWTYTVGNQTYQWNEYRAALMNQIINTEKALAAAQAVAAPWEVQDGSGAGW